MVVVDFHIDVLRDRRMTIEYGSKLGPGRKETNNEKVRYVEGVTERRKEGERQEEKRKEKEKERNRIGNGICVWYQL